MIKTILKSIVKLTFLLLIVLIMALLMSKILRPKRLDEQNNTKAKVLGFYKLKKNTLDVLVLGSSHAYYAINPAIINQNTDLNSYVFGGECQPIEVSYYFLKEALQYQNPKLVIVDVFGISESINTCKIEGIYRVNLENLKTGINKYDAFKTLFDEKDILYNIFDVSLYHNRWFEVNLHDILNQEIDKNFGYTIGTNYSHNLYEFDNLYNNEVKKADLTYIKKIKELCDENGIELLLIKTPYYLSKEDAEIFTYLKNNDNYNFIDFNQILPEINYQFDLDGDIWHANVYGAGKISDYLSDYIKQHYKIKSTSDIYDDDYYKVLVKVKNTVYPREYNLEKVLIQVKNENQILLMNYNYFPGSLLTENEKKLLDEIGYDFKNHSNKKAIIKVENGEREAYYSDDYFFKEFNLGNNIFKVESNGYMWKNNISMNIANNYACVSVIDSINYEIIDSFCMDTEGGLFIHRDHLEE